MKTFRLKILALLIGALILLMSSTWAFIGRTQVPGDVVEQILRLNQGRFYIDENSLLLVRGAAEEDLRTELLKHPGVIEVTEAPAEDQPWSPGSPPPIPTLNVKTWVSNPFFASFEAEVAGNMTGEGFKRRYVWGFVSWIHLPLLDVYWIS